uniref:NELL2-interacting cell ontogeny regulator 1 n=2 Tax=Hucho hucho TaxID=62062 RepID=A0A4W5L517_9TELE
MLRNMIAAYPKVSYAEIRSLSSPGLPLDMLHRRMALSGYLKAVMLLSFRPGFGEQETGTVIPAESRPCVDCHAFEFMQRALHNLKKTAFNLDVRTETLVLRAERQTLCDCMLTNSLH